MWLSLPKRRSQMPIACGVGTLFNMAEVTNAKAAVFNFFNIGSASVKGFNLIFKMSVALHGKQAQEATVLIDTTVLFDI
jgi:hypothetical protein